MEDVMTEWIDTSARTVARVGSKYGIMGFHKVQQLRGKEKEIVEEEGAAAVREGMRGMPNLGIRSKIAESVSGVSVRTVMDAGESHNPCHPTESITYSSLVYSRSICCREGTSTGPTCYLCRWNAVVCFPYRHTLHQRHSKKAARGIALCPRHGELCCRLMANLVMQDAMLY